MKEYAVMRNGYYLQETDKEGMYNQVNDLSKATMFTSITDITYYIENELKLNLSNVSIHMVETVIKETPLVINNGDFVDINSVRMCNVCKKWFAPMDMKRYQHDLESDKEWVCDKCYEELDDKYANSLDEQFGNPLEELDKLIGGLKVK
jgi:hypothetical protein